MLTEIRTALINDLRFAIEVMEDRSHLGLNAERAATLKALMERRIYAAQNAIKPSARVTKPIIEKTKLM
ncbi:MAG TPA: hypothetical protein VKR52_14600 [Terracidiphilus sp.]|nr:hypothetical protein [Terracidiphilus sp.]